MAPERSDRDGGRPGPPEVGDGRADPGDPPPERTAGPVDELLGELHDHLAATAALPVETRASRWLGEAEAVAADIADGDAPTNAVATRVTQVAALLSHVEGTGNEAADEHVAAARALAAELSETFDGPGDRT